MPTIEELKDLQAISLQDKVYMTQVRLREWVRYYGIGGTYISFSGGKDSTVLLDIARQIYPSIDAVFIDTGLEYPEVRDFAKSFDNVTEVNPKMVFDQVLIKYGYPVFGKEIARSIGEYQKWVKGGRPEKKPVDVLKILGEGRFGEGSIYNKTKYLNIAENADFKISSTCCDAMKKRPCKSYNHKNYKVVITAETADESLLRKSNWLKYGCNAFDNKTPVSKPLSFWKEQDILSYIKQNNLKIASVYGDICETDPDGNFFEGLGIGKLHCTGCNRTGCIFCAFGAHLEKGNARRFVRLKETHPKQYNYCINGGEYNIEGLWQPNKKGLGMGRVLDYIGVDF